jgi:DNA-binding CsgD family transcriptional regulator
VREQLQPKAGRNDETPRSNPSKIDGLLRELVRELLSDRVYSQELGNSPESGDLLLDTTIDGVRYLLLRMAVPAQAHPLLSPREQEIVRMVAKGYPNKTIAAVLNISSWTVCTHLRRTFTKLGVASRAAMVARLLEEDRVRDHWNRPETLASANPPVSPRSTRSCDIARPQRNVTGFAELEKIGE